LLSIYSFLNILFTEGQKLFGFPLNGYNLFLILFGIILMVWEGNRLIENSLDRIRLKNLKKVHPLIIQFLLSVLLVVVVALIPVLIFMEFHGFTLADGMLYSRLSLGFGFRVNLFLNSINAIVFFINQYKKKELEAEELKKITIEAQFEALRTQINPHFLFNSFNVLSTLVHKDPDTSAAFIQQLSKVYRYLLNGHQKKLVKLYEEMEFIKSYIFLLSIRFKNNLKINNEITSELNELYIAPASLQMLIENAIKHNIVSHKKPLQIDLFSEGKDYIIVRNNLQEKVQPESSTALGLKNIRRRYQFISNKPVEVVRNTDYFMVKIPLVELVEI
jgi:sensor histidine kinase YesM